MKTYNKNFSNVFFVNGLQFVALQLGQGYASSVESNSNYDLILDEQSS